MSTQTAGDAPVKKTPKFTVSDAARAFRQARGDAEKIERVENEKKYLRRDESGRFVLVRGAKTANSRSKIASPGARARKKR